MHQRNRHQSGLPDFPLGWVEDPHEHHRPTYEQIVYSAFEHRQQLQHQNYQQHGDDLGFDQNNFDMQAMNAALAGPHNSGSINQLMEPIQRLMDAKRVEAERAREIAARYQNEPSRGPDDAVTREAQEIALQAEAEAGGVLAVERALEHAPEGQALHQIATTVQAFEEEKRRTQAAYNEAFGRFGDNHQNTFSARMAALQAEAAWQGAAAAQAAPAQRGFDAAEHPIAIADRASAAAQAYFSEADELHRKADMLKRKWGKNDPRVLEAEKAAEEKAALGESALKESDTAQGFAEGKPEGSAPAKAEAKKKPKKQKKGIC